MLGGGMRQVGILAAAGLWALQHNVNRLAEDHTNARRLAQGLAAIPGIEIDPGAVETNMVFFGLKADSGDLAERLRARGVRISDSPDGRMRAVTSSEVSREDIDYALTVIADEVSPAVPVLT
jgi:threonine aldolase